ncbi:MAG: general stress protein [Rothia sp. (in: high G+C Gram-positive bacteria)]|nr:general stress protein [Rothia sp. (in: high G+C Gram-positive bacteria)]
MNQLKAPPALAMADGAHLPPGELVATFTDRKEVTKAIEFLASQKFPVHSLFIVGHDVQQIDYVTGQATYPRAALGGVIQGLGLGALVALFNAVITQTSILANLLSIVPLAIAFCIIYSIFVASRSKGRGIRTRSQMLPQRFDLMAIPATAQAARHLLRVTVQPTDTHSGVRGPAAHPFAQQGPQKGQTSSPYIHPGMSQANPQGYAAQQPQSPRPSQAPQQSQSSQNSQGPAAPEGTSAPAFVPPAETNRDGSKAAGKYGLRVETPEEFEATIRKAPHRAENEKTQ